MKNRPRKGGNGGKAGKEGEKREKEEDETESEAEARSADISRPKFSSKIARGFVFPILLEEIACGEDPARNFPSFPNPDYQTPSGLVRRETSLFSFFVFFAFLLSRLPSDVSSQDLLLSWSSLQDCPCPGTHSSPCLLFSCPSCPLAPIVLQFFLTWIS